MSKEAITLEEILEKARRQSRIQHPELWADFDKPSAPVEDDQVNSMKMENGQTTSYLRWTDSAQRFAMGTLNSQDILQSR